MELIVDECLHADILDFLEESGFSIQTIDDILSWGALDEDIFSFAVEHKLAIITHDKEFGKLYFESTREPATIIVITMDSPYPQKTIHLLQKTFKHINLAEEKYKGKLVIISPRKIRVRTKYST